MDQQLIQRTRYVLRSRARRAQACPDALFIVTCCQFVNWIENHPILKPLVYQLKEVEGEFREQITTIMNEAPISGNYYDPGFYNAKSSNEHAALCYELVRSIAEIDTTIDIEKQQFLIVCFGEYLTKNEYMKHEDAIQAIRDVAIDGLYEYLDEQIDLRNLLYAVLLKYKQRAEWFRRSRLRQVATENQEGKTGERALISDIQEYVLDQGVEFVVEPSSASGEVDLILRDSEGRYIIIDAKYLKENAKKSQIKEKLASGFHQVARYCEDYNEHSGFLVTFNESPSKLRLELDELHGFRFLKVGGKTVYHLTIGIANLPSASKAGKANEIKLTREELIESS